MPASHAQLLNRANMTVQNTREINMAPSTQCFLLNCANTFLLFHQSNMVGCMACENTSFAIDSKQLLILQKNQVQMNSTRVTQQVINDFFATSSKRYPLQNSVLFLRIVSWAIHTVASILYTTL